MKIKKYAREIWKELPSMKRDIIPAFKEVVLILLLIAFLAMLIVPFVILAFAVSDLLGGIAVWLGLMTYVIAILAAADISIKWDDIKKRVENEEST